MTFSVPELPGDYDGDGTVDEADYNVWRTTYGSTTDLRADGNDDGHVDAADYTVWRDSIGQLPTVVTPAAASPSTVTDTSTDLSVLGNTVAGEENLTYTWTVSGPADVSFSANGDNAAKNTTATFGAAGEYEFTVVIENTLVQAITTSSVLVTVEQTVAGVAVGPTDEFVAAGAMLQLTASEIDQFGDPIDSSSEFAWTIASGGGSVSDSGLFTAPSSADTTTVHVESASGSADAALYVVAPVAWYETDATSGTTLADSSASGNTGTVTGTAAWVSGVGGNALSLGGGHAELPTGIVSGLDDCTIATWFYLDSVDAWSRVFDFGSGTNVNMFLTPAASSATGPLRFAITTSGNGSEQQIDGPVLSTGQWYHVAITLAGDTGTMYVNGQAVGTNANPTLDPADMGATTQNYLGDSQYEADPALLGKIDDVRIYGEALSAEQILAMACPMVVSPAAAADDPVTTSWTTLSVLGDDLTAGESALVYYWETVGDPPAPVAFSSNDSNVAKNTTATFAADGDYDLQVTITNATTGLATTSLVSFEVTGTASGAFLASTLLSSAEAADGEANVAADLDGFYVVDVEASGRAQTRSARSSSRLARSNGSAPAADEAMELLLLDALRPLRGRQSEQAAVAEALAAADGADAAAGEAAWDTALLSLAAGLPD